MIRRSTILWVAAGALGASICLASACEPSSPPGFDLDAGNGGSNNTGSGNTSTNENTSGNTGGGTSTGSETTGNSTGSTTGSETNSTGTGSSTGTGTGTGSSAGFCGTSGMYAMPCSAAVAAGAITLANCVANTIFPMMSGSYVSAYGDGTSTACVDTMALCATGMSTAKNTTGSLYGSGITITIPTGFTPSGTGLGYTLSALPTYGLQISVTDTAGNQYFFEIPAGTTTLSGTVLWGTFNTHGDLGMTVPDGGPYSTAAGLTSIGFQANTGTAAASWTFCLTSLTL